MDTKSLLFFPPHHQPGLFRSQAWLDAWHKSWGDHPSLQLLHLNDNSLTDLSQSLARTRMRKKRLLPIVVAFPAGVSTNVTPSIRGEYFFFPNQHLSATEAVNHYFDQALKHAWDQFYIPDILRSSEAYSLTMEIAPSKGLHIIHDIIEHTYAVDLRQRNFNGYVEQLGRNTRLALFNRRKNLEELGEIKVENIWPDRHYFYQLINHFHQKRWGKDCYVGRNQLFIDLLLNNLSEQGHEADLSVLSIADKPVSAMLDIRFEGRQYNLQSGYLERFHKSIPLGTVHFGYQIESAFQNPHIAFYDFMAGKGKNADYKKYLVNSQDEFASLILVRSPWLKALYKFHAALKRQRILR